MQEIKTALGRWIPSHEVQTVLEDKILRVRFDYRMNPQNPQNVPMKISDIARAVSSTQQLVLAAEGDLTAAKSISSQNYHSQAVWLTAQAVEKAYKAILAALGLRYEDKHYKKLGHDTNDISKLLPEALHEPVDPEIARLLATLTSRAETSRYPSGSSLIAPAEEKF